MLNVPHTHIRKSLEPGAFFTHFARTLRRTRVRVFLLAHPHIREILRHQFILLLATSSVPKSFILSYLFCSTLISLRVSFQIDLFAFGLICSNINTASKKRTKYRDVAANTATGVASVRFLIDGIPNMAYKIMRFILKSFSIWRWGCFDFF